MSHVLRVASAAALLGGVLAGVTPAQANHAPKPIHPGVQTNTAGSQCTANFVFSDSAGKLYIGQSAHCASLGGPTDINGCTTASRPLNTNVTIGGATRPGKLVYSSWIAMQTATPPPATSSQECLYNDFAVISIDPADYSRVDPTVPFWGGPNGLNTTGQGQLRDVYTYGNSSLRFGLTQLSPKQGITSATTHPSGWSLRMYTATPGIPGDSGSAILDENGNAIATLSTVSADGSNGGAMLHHALNYLRAHSSLTSLQLVNGTTQFAPLV